MPPSSTPPPQWSPMPPVAPQKRSVWPWILGIGAVLVFMGIGGLILIIALASMSNSNNRNSNANSNANGQVANRNSNSNNANTRATLSSYTDDFSTRNWYSGESQFGRSWYDDDEFHLHSTKTGYIVLYAPNRKDYYDENSTVRITTRSVDGEAPNSGYGLLVHGEKTDTSFQDIGFLIKNGDNPQYAIVQHKASSETKIVNWTSSSTIRTGTTPNQLEVRIRDRRLDFYVNGQFLNSITDTESLQNGRVGLYTSDTTEVAFDDLEISR
jgi:hypothetical protein